MKVRVGFVSNSSSSSFYIADLEEKHAELMREKLLSTPPGQVEFDFVEIENNEVD